MRGTWAQRNGYDGARVRVIGDDALVARYAAALDAGRRRSSSAPTARPRRIGLWRIAVQAGIVNPSCSIESMNPLAPYLDPLPLDRRPARHHAGGSRRHRRRARRQRLSHPRGAAQFAAALRLHPAPRATMHGATCLVGAGTVLRVEDVRARARRGRTHRRDAARRPRGDSRGEGAGHAVRARRRDADRGVRGARGGRRRAQDVSRRRAAARRRCARGARCCRRTRWCLPSAA